jgi:hypothetical protein
MAAGIHDDQGKLVAGLSISAPTGRLDKEWLPKLQAVANEISRILGYQPDTAREWPDAGLAYELRRNSFANEGDAI